MDKTPVSATSLWVGNYQRRMAVSLERMYENALDWEHLPHLHNGAFSHIELISGGDWGWRARVGVGANNGGPRDPDSDIILQLSLDRERHRWVSATLEGPGQGSEIWTHVFCHGERDIEISADFFVPGIAEENRADVGRFYTDLYRQLYDEDEAMMLKRQQGIDEKKAAQAGDTQAVDLGLASDIRSALPLAFDHSGRRWVLQEQQGQFIAHSANCPHRLGPLDEAVINEGVIECPWHGYRFDVQSGQCLSGPKCQLPTAPPISCQDGRVIAG